ncbi:MAG: signal peptidase II [Actinomycetota bacterium]|nr:signal peptidase II [Actinomycetota bacterium]
MADEQRLAEGLSPPEAAAATHGPARSSRFGRLDQVLAIAAVVVCADQLTKWWAVTRLPRGMIHVIGSLRLNLAYNTGTAFSIGTSSNIGPIIALLAVVVIVLFLLSGGSARRASAVVAGGLVIGGALGNLADRAFRDHGGFMGGAVVDFIDLQWWPVFNVADSAIVIGACVAVVANLRAPSA